MGRLELRLEDDTIQKKTLQDKHYDDMEALGQQVGSRMRSPCGDAEEADKERIAYLEDQYAAVFGKVEATGNGLEKVSNAQKITADSLTTAVTRFAEIVGEERKNRAVQHKEVEKRFEG